LIKSLAKLRYLLCHWTTIPGYGDTMTKLLDQAVEAAQSAPPETQDDVARMILTYFGREQTPAELSPEDEAAVTKARAAVARGEIATDERMRAIWAKYAL
jgi:hypothetical protein